MVEPSGALEGGARGAAWQRRWGDLRARRIAILVALPLGLLVGVLSGGWPGWLIAVGMPAFALIRLHAFRCPECRGRFTGTAIAPMPSACMTCGLAAFDDPETNVASAATGATRRSMPPSIRLVRLVAVSQTLGGILVGSLMILLPFQGYTLAWWYFSMMEGIAIASVASGVWLWQGRSEGVRLARLLLALQVVKVYTPWIAYDLRAGFGILLHAGAGAVGARLDASGKVVLALGPGFPPEFAVNVLALVWLCALLRARTSEAPASPSAGASPAAPIT